MSLGEIMMNKQVNKRHNKKASQLRKNIVLFLLSVFVLSPVHAAGWKTTSFKIEVLSSSNIKVSKAILKDMESYLNLVAIDYQSQGFLEPAIDTMSGKSYKVFVGLNSEKPKTSAYYVHGKELSKYNSIMLNIFDSKPDEDDWIPLKRHILINSTKLMSGESINPVVYHNLAHELFHAVQQSYELVNTHSDLGDWIMEGTADAIAYDMAFKYRPKPVSAIDGSLGTIFQPLQRFGIRNYTTTLTVSDDDNARYIEAYGTSSFWRYIGEYDNSNPPTTLEVREADYSYLSKFFKRNIDFETNSDKEIDWLDKNLKAHKKISKALDVIYSLFVTTFAHHSHKLKVLSTVANKQKEALINEEKWRKIAFGSCPKIELDLAASNSQNKTVSRGFHKITAACFEVNVKKPKLQNALPVSITISIKGTNKKNIESLKWIGIEKDDNSVLLKKGTDVKYNSTTKSYFSSWTFTGLRAGQPLVFIPTNVASKASETGADANVLAFQISLSNSSGEYSATSK